MAETFADLGLRPELVAEAEAAGFAFPTPLQRAAMPVLRRGGNAVLHASEGAGVTAAYGLALLDRLAGELAGAAAGGGEAIRAVDGERGERGERALQAVVLVPLDEAAARIAIFLARFARPLGLRVLALERDWPPVRTGADVLVAAPAALLEAIQKSLVKLDAVRAFVVHGASTMLSLIRREVLEDIANSMPREAQRVLTSGELSAAVEDYIERHVRRPLRFGGRAAEPAAAGGAAAAAARRVDYSVVAASEKLVEMAAALASGTATRPVLLFCRTRARAESAADALALRGFRVGGPDVEEADVIPLGPGAASPPGAAGQAVSHDVPFDAETLAERHEHGGLVLVEPRELPHFQRITAEAGFEAHALAPARAAAGDDVRAFRDRLRRAVREEDVAAQLLVLEPLLEEFAAAEVAAAAAALLRRRPAAGPAPAERARARAPRAGAPPPPPAWFRLFVSAGQRDGLRPGDLLGAITGEAGVSGEQIGRIEIRDTHSTVEVTGEIAERVIQALNGTTLKGRSLRVDYDRKPAPAPGRRGRTG